MTTIPDLALVGEALYGPLWRTELARQLGVTYRTMRRWLAGQSPIPAGIARDLAVLITAAEKRLAAARAMLDGEAAS